MKKRKPAFFLLLLLGCFVLWPPTKVFLEANNFDWHLSMLFFLFLCTFSYLLKHGLLRGLFLLLGAIACLYSYFPLTDSFSLSWLFDYSALLKTQITQLIYGELTYFTETLAFPLFLLVLVLLGRLLIHHRNWPLPFLIIIGYLMMVDAFRSLDMADDARWFIFIVLLFALVTQLQDISFKHLLLISFGGLLVLGATALLLPHTETLFAGLAKERESLTAPLRDEMNSLGLYDWLDSYGLGGIGQTGFSENDQQLGGPLADNNEPLFTAHQNERHYWRVETKTDYTGNGWKTSTDHRDMYTMTGSSYTITDPATAAEFGETQPITLELNANTAFVPLPYGNVTLTIPAALQEENRQLLYYPSGNRVVIANLSRRNSETIQLQWEKKNYTIEELQQVTPPSDTAALSSALEIPAAFPERVKKLAHEITEKYDNYYDKVDAIENYLKYNSDLRYSKIDAKETPEGRDYVDYFLFDVQIGYCNNFSSAMVMMLRSIGIPARWTKGFTGGTLTDVDSSGLNVYTILNSDAHAWPEVYFAEYGWIPFEPTPNFSNPRQSAPVDAKEETGQSDAAETAAETETTETSTAISEVPSINSDTAAQDETVPQKAGSRTALVLLLILAGAILAAALFCRRYYSWFIFLIYLHLFAKQFAPAYRKLLKRCSLILPRKDSEPLLDYARRLESRYPELSGTWIELTQLYEAQTYGAKPIALATAKEALRFTARKLFRLQWQLKKKQ